MLTSVDALPHLSAVLCSFLSDASSSKAAILSEPGSTEPALEDAKALLSPIPSKDPSQDTAASATLPKPPQSATKPMSRYLGKVSLDAKHINGDLDVIAQEIVKRLAGLEGCDVRVSVEIEAQTIGSFDEEIRRSISESSQKLKFSKSDFSSL